MRTRPPDHHPVTHGVLWILSLFIRLIGLSLFMLLIFFSLKLVDYFGFTLIPVLLLLYEVHMKVMGFIWINLRYFSDGSSTFYRIVDPEYQKGNPGKFHDRTKKWLLSGMMDISERSDFGRTPFSYRMWGHEKSWKYFKLVIGWFVIEISFYVFWILGYLDSSIWFIYIGWVVFCWGMFFLSVVRVRSNMLDRYFGKHYVWLGMYFHQLLSKMTWGIVLFEKNPSNERLHVTFYALIAITVAPIILGALWFINQKWEVLKWILSTMEELFWLLLDVLSFLYGELLQRFLV